MKVRGEYNDDSTQRFLQLIELNPIVVEILRRIHELELPDAWLVSGCLFQSAWNALAGEAPERGIRDYDIFYFDATDIDAGIEAQINERAATLFADLDCEVDVRNQARVHTWYADEFGFDGYPPLERTTDGIDHFLAVCCMVAVRPTGKEGTGIQQAGNDPIELYAPFGVADVLDFIMRPNPWFPDAPVDCYYRKAERWQSVWPALTVEPFGVTAPASGSARR